VLHVFRPIKKKKLDGNVLITGGGSGLGRLIAHSFAKAGCTVILFDINADGLAKVRDELLKDGYKVFTYEVDIAQREILAGTAATVKQRHGKIDYLINNAGVVRGDYIWDLSDDQIEKVFRVNTFAPIWLTKALIGDMIEQNKGHVVTIASAAAFQGTPKLADYAASKAAVFGFAETLRLELRKIGKTGVHTTIVCPFYINTGMFDGVAGVPLFPILDPVVVVGQIMEAIRTNKAELLIPSTLHATFLGRYLLPVPIRDVVVEWLGITKTMDEFKSLRKIK